MNLRADMAFEGQLSLTRRGAAKRPESVPCFGWNSRIFRPVRKSFGGLVVAPVATGQHARVVEFSILEAIESANGLLGLLYPPGLTRPLVEAHFPLSSLDILFVRNRLLGGPGPGRLQVAVFVFGWRRLALLGAFCPSRGAFLGF